MSSAALIGAGITVAGSVAGAAISSSMAGKPPSYNAGKANANVDKHLGAALSALSGAAGEIKNPSVRWLKAAQQALDFTNKNEANFAKTAEKQSIDGTNTILKQIALADPMFTAKRDQADKNNMALMKGEIPIDVQRTLARTGAFASLQGGLGGGSEQGRNMRARDFGTTSMELASVGEAGAQRWTALISDAITRPAFVSPNSIMQFSGLSSQQGVGSEIARAQMQLEAEKARAGIMASGADLQMRAGEMKLGTQLQGYNSQMNAYNANAAQAANLGGAFSSALGGLGGMAMGSMIPRSPGASNYSTFATLNQASTAAPYASGFSNSGSLGWVPRATAV
jgi:hypothetical protein